jgi:hypothetical protein
LKFYSSAIFKFSRKVRDAREKRRDQILTVGRRINIVLFRLQL